jgi:hypothetical protein
MYKEHELFNRPADPAAPLWRYMDLAKFLALLEDQALFFATAASMTDKFEGGLAKPNLVMRSQMDHPFASFYNTVMSPLLQHSRRYTYLNCWHASQYESAAMWGLYQRDGQGVAVRSSFTRLSESLGSDYWIYIGTVNYVDYNHVLIPDGNGYAPYLYKRLSFEHEHEVRAVFSDMEAQMDAWDMAGRRFDPSIPAPAGINVPVNINRLVDCVYVAPDAAVWFAELVEKLIRRYGHDWPVKHSDLSQDPIY